ncbi:hypothetical protein Q8F55_000739 [Vanrija albida]|uniref:Uncharacterized protein n=1 Tax=Vanrija albida TaxID=181172 RepID=A0ABR3QE52_9TREE
MHLTLSFTPTTLTAALWDGLESVVELSAAFRTLGTASTAALLHALDTTLLKLAAHADLGAVLTVSGAVPHPTALAPGPAFASSRLDPALPAAAQLPDLAIADPFSPTPFPGGTAPLGYVLTTVLLQRAGAATPQERAMTAAFVGAETRAPSASAADSLGPVGAYWRERFGLRRARVLPFLPAALAIRLTLSPRAGDLVLAHGADVDYAVAPAPAPGGLPELVGAGTVHVWADANGPAARRLVRDKYANAKWDVLAHLASILPAGGAIGHDDKCFAFVRPYAAAPGTTRFELGAPVPEFRDLRANSRCVLESQVLELRREFPGPVGRVLLVARDLHAAIAPLLAAVFNADVHIADADADLASLGAAIVAIAASRRVPSAERERPPTPGGSSPLPSPPRPPSPSSPAASSDAGEGFALRLACSAPDRFEADMYAALGVEFARLSVLVDHGMVAPGRF